MEGVVSKKFLLYYSVSNRNKYTVLHMLTMFCIYKRDRPQSFFSISSKSSSDHPSKEREFLNYLATKLHILTPEDWYNVSKRDVMENGGEILLDRYNGSLAKLITTVFSEYPQNNRHYCWFSDMIGMKTNFNLINTGTMNQPENFLTTLVPNWG